MRLEGCEDLLAVQQGVHELRVGRQISHDDAVQDLQHDAQEVRIHLQLVRLVPLLLCNPLQALVSAQMYT